MEKNKQIVTIFGGTGDLTYRKLLPSFYDLMLRDKLPKDFHIVIIGRKPYDSEKYRTIAKPWLIEFSKLHKDTSKIDGFLNLISYYEMVFTEPNDYEGLKQHLSSLSPSASILYYLAVSPTYFEIIATNLNKYNLAEGNDVIIEKPFGNDLHSALQINETLTNIFGDEHIYRIDHYVAKTMVQNIFTFRFTNALFAHNWDNSTIKSIQINALETVGLEGRGGYYDHTGAIKDMIQNHLLQILSIITMSAPREFNSSYINKRQAQILRNLYIKNYDNDIVLGQYKGYLYEKDISETSTTETFAALKLFIDLPQWHNVPIYVRTGKNMSSKTTNIIVEYKGIDDFNPNILKINIQPDEAIYLCFNVDPQSSKDKDNRFYMECYRAPIYQSNPQQLEGYELLLFDALNHNHMLFASFEVVKLSWEFVERLKDTVNTKPYLYDPHSNGPIESNTILEEFNDSWIEE